MNPLELYAAKLAAITGKPVLVILSINGAAPIKHECNGEEHDGFKVNCDVYEKFIREARDFAESKGIHSRKL